MRTSTPDFYRYARGDLFVTSPFGPSYVEDAKRKRTLHKKHGTICFETTSAGFKNGRIFIELKAALERHGIPFSPMSHEAIANSLKGNPLKEFAKLSSALIAHAKEAGLTDEALLRRAQQASPFAIELLGKKYKGMVTFEGLRDPPEICTTCGQGYYVPRMNKQRKPFLGCSAFPTSSCTGKKNIPLERLI